MLYVSSHKRDHTLCHYTQFYMLSNILIKSNNIT